MKELGVHFIVDLFDCKPDLLNNVEAIEKILLEAARVSKATVIKPFFHKFNPHGISGIIVIAESHFSIHTWPEHNFAAIDVFTCGDLDSMLAVDYIKNRLDAKKSSVFKLKRGDLPTVSDTCRYDQVKEELNASVATQ